MYINKIQIISENIHRQIINFEKDYYSDILVFCNNLFCPDIVANSLLDIKFKQLSLQNITITTYNHILTKHNLSLKHITPEDIAKLQNNFKKTITFCKKISNNLLKKINYKLTTKTFGDKIVFKISLINNAFF